MDRNSTGWLLVGLLVLALAAGAAPVRILATGDLSGYLKGRPTDGYLVGGAGALFTCWKAREEYAPGKYLVLNSGDCMGSTQLSSLLEGEADIEVMNAVGFQASALGAHEFDFGRGQLLRLVAKATFPFLAANLTNPDGTPAEAAKPYAIIETQGVKVGVIGLVNRTLNTQANIGILKVGPYPEALRQYVPEMRAKGAQVIIVVGHVAPAELVALAPLVQDLRIPLMIGGYSHELTAQYIPGVATWVVCNGDTWAGYSRIELEVDAQDGSARVESVTQHRLQSRVPAPDAAIQAIIDRWQAKLGSDFTKPVATTNAGLLRSSTALSFILQSWLITDPMADFAMINQGGVRQDLTAGGITKADIISTLPFDDKLYRIKMTGRQLQSLHSAKGEQLVCSGLSLVDGKLVWTRTNQPIDEKTTYRVICIDYLYNTTDDLRAADPNPTVVLPDWRIPLYRWCDEHQTSKTRPVEKEMGLNPVLKIGENGLQ